ncbi:MAG: hypothetical protein ACXAEB_03120 [Candidatus Thorarchaeota archaeon]|jgi:DNA repair protein RadA
MTEMNARKSDLFSGFHTADHIIRHTISTGTNALDKLLGGGLEFGLVHLFYGDRSLHNDLMRMAVQMQLPEDQGGMNSSTIVIDSANIIRIDKFTRFSYEVELEPEEVMDKIYISRAFNASQTYELVMNQLESFFERVPAKLLLITGLPDLYLSDGMTGEGMQELTHMATKLMAFTLNRGIATVISAPVSQQSNSVPAGGKSLSSCAQVHVHFTESKSYYKYTLAKHPQYPIRRASRHKPVTFGTTLPLSHFVKFENE